MPPLLETMARTALMNRLDRAEQAIKAQSLVITHLTSALWHHLQDRHDARPTTDDAPDVTQVRNARRILGRTKTEVGGIVKSESDRGRRHR